LVPVACFLPGQAKDISASRYSAFVGVFLNFNNGAQILIP
jgi:hypothetical protein